jgi:hypothetical protein
MMRITFDKCCICGIESILDNLGRCSDCREILYERGPIERESRRQDIEERSDD